MRCAFYCLFSCQRSTGVVAINLFTAAFLAWWCDAVRKHAFTLTHTHSARTPAAENQRNVVVIAVAVHHRQGPECNRTLHTDSGSAAAPNRRRRVDDATTRSLNSYNRTHKGVRYEDRTGRLFVRPPVWRDFRPTSSRRRRSSRFA